MVYFQTKYLNLGKLCSALEWKMLVHFVPIRNMYITVIWYSLGPNGKIVAIWYFILFWYINCIEKNLATLVTLNP
jgi:hypothetical protein